MATGCADCVCQHWLEILPLLIIITAIGDICVWLFCPDTKHRPLEEIAELFGDDDLVVVYQRNIHIYHEKSEIVLEVDREVEKTADVLIG